MSRTERRIKNRQSADLHGYAWHTEAHAESDCKPGCQVCDRGPLSRRRRSKARRQQDRAEIADSAPTLG